MTTYRSALGWQIALPVALLISIITPLFAFNGIWVGVAINLAVTLFVLHMYLTTRYTLSGGNLNVRSGFLFSRTVNVKTIKRIGKTDNPASSPAFSLDRIEIVSNDGTKVIVSPKQREKFIQEITSINPSIIVEHYAGEFSKQ